VEFGPTDDTAVKLDFDVMKLGLTEGEAQASLSAILKSFRCVTADVDALNDVVNATARGVRRLAFISVAFRNDAATVNAYFHPQGLQYQRPTTLSVS
jgi:hypothetical protein